MTLAHVRGPKRPRNPGQVSGVAQYVAPDSFTKSLLHFNDVDGSQVFVDEVLGRVWTPVNNARMSTGQSVFGGASGVFNTATQDYLTGDASADLTFGTGDFTIDFRILFSVDFVASVVLVDYRPIGTNGAYVTLFVEAGTRKLLYYQNGVRLTSTTLISSGVWYHIALSRGSGVTRMFINGIQEGGSYTDSTNYLTPAGRPFVAGDSAGPGANGLNGWIDEFRISKGIARWTSNFTPPGAQY